MSKRKRDGSTATSVDMTASWLPSAETENLTAAGLPQMTRKMKACTECRKQKIKCEMPGNAPPCTRCERRGISCILNKSVQALLDDKKQTEFLQCDVRNIHETVERLCRQLNVDPPRSLVSFAKNEPSTENVQIFHSDTDGDHDNECELSPPTSPSAVQAPIDTFLDIAKAGSLASPESPHGFRQRRIVLQQDLVNKGIISLEVAEELVQRYFSRLDHCLYGIASHYKDIQGLRQASPALFAAICTVSALHDPKDQKLYEVCNREYRLLVSRSLFEKTDIEYLRALCIGSFWLADASRILLCDAVRRAADIRLHRHFYHAINTNGGETSSLDPSLSFAEARDRIRLWYSLFVCDQHLSVLHNRDGLLCHDKEILEKWEIYLSSGDANHSDSDLRIISQVSLLLIMNSVRDVFGSELPGQVRKSLAVQLNHFSRELEEWFSKFSALYGKCRVNESMTQSADSSEALDPRIGDSETKGLQMHYQFGKLYLGHHIFRGLKSDPVPLHFLTAAHMAHGAAMTIFELISNDEKLQESLVGRLHYFYIMIAFAGHFLLEVCNKHSEQLMINLDDNFQLVAKVLDVFTNMPSIPPHPIGRMTNGLGRKLADCASNHGRDSTWSKSLGQPSGANFFQPPRATFADISTPMLDSNKLVPESPFDFSTGQLPHTVDEFSYADFGEFNFPDMRLNFLT